MTREEARNAILIAVRKTLNDDSVTIDDHADLIEGGVLDSLDGMVFLLELSTLSGKDFPEEKSGQNLKELGFFRVDKLVEYLVS